MAEKLDAHIGANSREEIAFRLFQMIAHVEKKSTSATDESGIKAGWTKADKAYILKTYGECITTVRDGWYQAK